MLKKILALFKLLVTGALWTFSFAYAVRWLLIFVWKFDPFYKKQWAVVANYWNNNGVIMSVSDYMFFLTFFVAILIWLVGWRFFYKTDYVRLLTAPILYVANYSLKKYENEDKHVVIKNIAIGEKITLEEVIQGKIKSEKTQDHHESKQLRQNITEKIIKRKEQ